MYSNLKALRDSLGMTQKEFASSISLALTTYNGYETGTREPKSDFWIAIAQKYGVTIDYLMGFSNAPHPTNAKKITPLISSEANHIAIRYQKLDTYGKAAVQAVMTEEENRIKEQAELDLIVTKPESKVIPLYLTPAAAGYASPAFGSEYEDYTLTDEDPRGAEFAIKLQGDSMEPHFPDGSIVFCNRDPIGDGDIGVFFVDGDIFCKQYHKDRLGMIYLFSLNRKRADADIILSQNSNRGFACFGRIITKKKLPLPQ